MNWEGLWVEMGHKVRGTSTSVLLVGLKVGEDVIGEVGAADFGRREICVS